MAKLQFNKIIAFLIGLYRKANIHDVLFVILLTFILIIVLVQIDHPLDVSGGDASGNYFIARDIAHFNTFPLVGPDNGVLGNNFSSPVYFYLISVPLMIYDDFLTLQIVNILFQAASLLLVYLIARKMFGKETAVISALIFGFSPIILMLYNHIWQPSLMQPIFLLGFYFLVNYSYIRKYWMLSTSLFLFVLAGSIHNSAFALLIPALLVTHMYIFVDKKNVYFHIINLAVVLGSLLLLYIPTIIFFGMHGINPFININGDFFAQFFPSFLEQINIFTNSSTKIAYLLDGSFTLFFLLLIPFYFFTKAETAQKIKFLMTFLFLVFFYLASIFIELQQHYIIPTISLTSILVAAILFQVFFNRKTLVIVGVFLLLITFYNSSREFEFVEIHKNIPSNTQILESAANAITQEISLIKVNGKYDDPPFFTVHLESENTRYVSPYVLFVPVEKILNEQMIASSDYGRIQYRDPDQAQYIFWGCFFYDKNYDEEFYCKSTYSKNDEFTLEKEVYHSSRLNVVLFKRI